MRSSAKKIIALFMLAVFAFPFIQKGIHEHEHHAEVQCTAKADKHFHEAEHTCSVCDFTMPGSEKPAEATASVDVDSSAFNYSSLTQQIVYLFVEQFFLQRAPPAKAQ